MSSIHIGLGAYGTLIYIYDELFLTTTPAAVITLSAS